MKSYIFSAAIALITSFSIQASDVKSGGQTSVKKEGSNAFSLPAANLPMSKRLDFSVGNSFFRNPWVPAPSSTDARDGLGPLFNTNGCQNCHLKDGRGHPALQGDDNAVSMLVRISIPALTEQQKAIAPTPNGRRKVVLATNIAETSLTIEGIRLVVDSGLERVAKFDLKTGVTKLEQVKISQSSAEQRAGRAGRIEEGLCVRLYSEAQLQQQPLVPVPEILHSDLSSLLAELIQWGAASADELQWLDTPPQAALAQASSLLQQLGLLDHSRQFTAQGKQAQQLGLEPRIASMLTKAKQHSSQLLNAAIAAAALIEEPDVSDSSYVVMPMRL